MPCHQDSWRGHLVVEHGHDSIAETVIKASTMTLFMATMNPLFYEMLASFLVLRLLSGCRWSTPDGCGLSAQCASHLRR